MRATSVARGFLNNSSNSLPRWMRALLTVRPDETIWIRYPKDMSTRTPEHPNYDGVGPAHNLSNNYYYDRDFKRAAKPIFRIGNTLNTPLLVATTEGDEEKSVAVDSTGVVTPGRRYVASPPSE
eukprot:m.88614 g.88614  ORF g.88614 m.88614 type:complete len:124 (-) comp26219_c0_seq1:28-399(-)